MNDDLNQEQLKLRKKNRTTMLGLIALFAMPILTAIIIFNNTDNLEFGARNRGDLIRPARPLEPVELQDINSGDKLALSVTKDFWTLVYFVGAQCDESCFTNLVKMRQSRLAQGGELQRVKRVAIFFTKQNADVLKRLADEHQGLIMLTGAADKVAALASQFEIKDQTPVSQGRRIYMLDPLGNLMLKYEETQTASDIAKDFKRLLHVSQIG